MRLLSYPKLRLTLALIISIYAAVTQVADRKFLIQSSPTLSGNQVTVLCLIEQAYAENSRPSVEWTLNRQLIDFAATKYDRFSFTAASGPGNITTEYYLTIRPSDSGDNNATVSCRVRGYPPSEIRLYVYDSLPTVIANGDGNIAVGENMLFRASFQIIFNFQGDIAVGYYQNNGIVGKEEWRSFDKRANVSLPAFKISPMNNGTLFVRIVVGGFPFIRPIFNLTVVSWKGPSPTSRGDATTPSSTEATSKTATKAATTAQTTTSSPTATSTAKTSDIVSSQATSESTVSSPQTTPSENGTEVSSVVSDAAPDANLIFGVVFGIIGLLLVVFLLACCRKSSRVKSCWRRIRETLKNEKRNGVQQREPDIVSDVSSPADSGTSTAASSPRQTISTDDVGVEPSPGQPRRPWKTDGGNLLTRDCIQGTNESACTHREMRMPDALLTRDCAEGMVRSATHELKGYMEMMTEEVKDTIESSRCHHWRGK